MKPPYMQEEEIKQIKSLQNAILFSYSKFNKRSTKDRHLFFELGVTE